MNERKSLGMIYCTNVTQFKTISREPKVIKCIRSIPTEILILLTIGCGLLEFD